MCIMSEFFFFYEECLLIYVLKILEKDEIEKVGACI